MTRDDQMLDYLRRKGIGMGFARICDHFLWPGPEVEAILGKLLKQRLIFCPGPRQYQAVTETFNRTPRPDREAPSSPPIAESVDREHLLGPVRAEGAAQQGHMPPWRYRPGESTDEPPAPDAEPNDEAPASAAADNQERENDVKRKKCKKCEVSKGPTAFSKDPETQESSDTCRLCEKGAKPRGAKRRKEKATATPAPVGAWSDVITEAVGKLREKRAEREVAHAAELAAIDAAIGKLEAAA